MDGDIDIEEHDVLDNPAIKNIFPDISVLKKEICVFDEEASTIKEETDDSQFYTQKDVNKDHQNYTNFKSLLKHKSIEEIDLTENDDISFVEQRHTSFLFQNKIILGSKPSQDHKNNNVKRENSKNPFQVRIFMDDIGPNLEKNKKFCKNCQILFAQKDDLEKHVKDYHSLNITCRKNAKNIREDKCMGIKCQKYDEKNSNVSDLKEQSINHEMNLKNRKTDNRQDAQANSVTNTVNVKSRSQSKIICFHCKKTFLSRRLLIKHIYSVLQTSKTKTGPGPRYNHMHKYYINITKSNVNEPLDKVAKKINAIKSSDGGYKNSQKGRLVLYKNISLYRCLYCSHYMKKYKNYIAHLANKHKDTNMTKVIKVTFDPNCKYCDIKCRNVYLYNRHLRQKHREKIDKIIKIQPKICIPKVELVLARYRKAINVCDSIDTAGQNQDYGQHYDITDMETFENRNFSKTETFKDKDIVNTDKNINEDGYFVLKNVLFKCKRCDINFLSAKIAKNHSNHMEMLINWKCSDCRKIFKKDDEALHLQQHSFTNNFTVYELNEIELARILYKCSKCAIHFSDDGYFSHLKKCGSIVSESTYCIKCDILIDKALGEIHEFEHRVKNLSTSDFTVVNSDAITKRKDHQINRNVMKNKAKISPSKKKRKSCQEAFIQTMLKMNYCETCKCFVSQALLRAVHRQGRCGHLVKYICKHCGLILTAKALVSHKKLHQDGRNYKLQDYSFYSLKSGKQISPPMPEYPKCEACNVQFISKMAVTNHICAEIDFLTCPCCDDKLSENVFKLHLAFHNYSMKGDKKGGVILKKQSEIIHFEENTINIHTKLGSDTDVKANNSKNESELIQVDVSVENKLVEQNSKDSISTVLSIEKTSEEKLLKKAEPVPAVSDKISSDIDLFNVLYCCVDCFVTVHTFDKVVEHSQAHFIDKKIGTDVDICKICKLRYEVKHKEVHEKFHSSQSSEKPFKILQFDTFCFSLDYKLWIKQLFRNLDDGITQMILNRSVYKTEGRVKMHTIQDGTSDLMVYKCNKCHIFVDPNNIFSHIENSCYKVRKNPCSYCGLPFISYLAMIEHQTIHEKNCNITLKSYRIVTFNQESDNNINKAIRCSRNQFVMYQCRQCIGMVNKYERANHKCNELDLKKCLSCGFLFYNADYKRHISRHELISTYTHKNMKIVLFGQGRYCKSKETLFEGVIIDYILFKCTRCELCIEKAEVKANKHDCYTSSSSKITCPKCHLYIPQHRFKSHSKLHNNDPDFSIENINIIPHAPMNLVKEKFEAFADKTNSKVKNKAMNTVLKKSDINNSVTLVHESKDASASERIAKIYKCVCGVHFLDSFDIKSHNGHCSKRASKQNCTKCNLLFTPNALFTHLLRHHGDKKYIYKYHIIEMSKTKNQIVELYKCNKCELQFLDRQTAKEHFDNCQKPEINKNKCKRCGLFFDDMIMDAHEKHHHNSNVADFVSIDVETNSTDTNLHTDIRIDQLTPQADIVRYKSFNMSEEALNQINLDKYSNKIYKCEKCNLHFLTEHALRRHRHDSSVVPQDVCDLCGLNFSLKSLTKHVYIHHKQMKLELSSFEIKF